MLVHIIADYGANDLAFAEVVQRIKRHIPDSELILTPVPPFSTLAAGFCIAQLALNDAPPGMMIYHNIAPREDDESNRKSNAGERLAFARTKTGVRVIGVNAGYAFSFLRDSVEELYWAAAESEGSQFRSRDLFPQAAAAMAAGAPGSFGKKISAREIPKIPVNRVAYIDGYGNLKTTISDSEIRAKTGRNFAITIQGTRREVLASKGSFDVKPGQLAFAPGSSGWSDGKGMRIRWMELFLRGGNAWEALGRPSIGSELQIT